MFVNLIGLLLCKQQRRVPIKNRSTRGTHPYTTKGKLITRGTPHIYLIIGPKDAIHMT